MTTPEDSPQVFEGTDITVDPEDLEQDENPAPSGPEETGDGAMGGTGGDNAGGAG